MKFWFEHDIILCRLPSHTSYKIQPLDVNIFGPLKTAYCELVVLLYPITGRVKKRLPFETSILAGTGPAPLGSQRLEMLFSSRTTAGSNPPTTAEHSLDPFAFSGN